MIEWIEFDSPRALRDFPMGDPSKRSFPVYLPPGFSASAKGLPTVYFLAGYGSRGASYLSDDSPFGVPFATRMDRAIEAKTLPPFVGVFPDCTSKLGHSQYLNSPSFGHYMDYLCDELVPLIEDTFGGNPTRRVLTGHSSGGFGALATALLRPGVFQAVSASASDSFFEISLLPMVNKALIEIEKSGGVGPFVESILSKPTARNIGSREFEAILLLAMAACYAPQPGKAPLHGDLFFDVQTGAILPEIWQRYVAWDPVHLIEKHPTALRALSHLQLECGMQDEHGLQWGHRQFAAKLRTHGIAHELVEYPGGHSGHQWRFEGRLQRLFEAVKWAP